MHGVAFYCIAFCNKVRAVPPPSLKNADCPAILLHPRQPPPTPDAVRPTPPPPDVRPTQKGDGKGKGGDPPQGPRPCNWGPNCAFLAKWGFCQFGHSKSEYANLRAKFERDYPDRIEKANEKGKARKGLKGTGKGQKGGKSLLNQQPQELTEVVPEEEEEDVICEEVEE